MIFGLNPFCMKGVLFTVMVLATAFDGLEYGVVALLKLARDIVSYWSRCDIIRQ
jgi:hypothetical protein